MGGVCSNSKSTANVVDPASSKIVEVKAGGDGKAHIAGEVFVAADGGDKTNRSR
jgi:hypothetical protein